MLFKRKNKEDMFDVKQRLKCIGIRVTNNEHKQLKGIARDWNIPVTTATRIIVQNYLEGAKHEKVQTLQTNSIPVQPK